MARETLQFGGDWTAQKLDRLRRYLEAYTTALKNQPFHLAYIDAFAGTGSCQPVREDDYGPGLFADDLQAETERYLKGSARIALEANPPFHSYTFIELSAHNCAQLARLKDEYPSLANRIQLITADANEHIRAIAADSWRGRRAVMFLDPYGMEVEWDTIRAVARTRAVDLWYLFPLMGVNRLLPKDGRIGEAQRKRLDTVLGATDWQDAFYREAENLNLFSGGPDAEKVADFSVIAGYVQERLAEEFAGVARNPLVLRDSRNHPLFLLCFAAANEAGAPIAVKIAEHILGR